MSRRQALYIDGLFRAVVRLLRKRATVVLIDHFILLMRHYAVPFSIPMVFQGLMKPTIQHEPREHLVPTNLIQARDRSSIKDEFDNKSNKKWVYLVGMNAG